MHDSVLGRATLYSLFLWYPIVSDCYVVRHYVVRRYVVRRSAKTLLRSIPDNHDTCPGSEHGMGTHNLVQFPTSRRFQSSGPWSDVNADESEESTMNFLEPRVLAYRVTNLPYAVCGSPYRGNCYITSCFHVIMHQTTQAHHTQLNS